jgi:uncharacterized membrane protein YfcA
MLPLAGYLLVTGVAAGFIAGLLGVGGGIVLVPVLFQLFVFLGVDLDVAMRLALGTSLATVIFTAWRSVRAHRARGAVDDALLRSWIVPVLVGVLFGSALAGILEGFVLTAGFAVIAFGVALYMAFGRETWKLSDQPPTGPLRHVLGIAVGFFSVLMGLGGGTLGVPALTLCGVPIGRAVGTASGLGLLIAVPGALWFALAGQDTPGRPPLSLGYVNLVGLCVIVPATVLVAPWGARLAHRLPRIALRRVFALFLTVASAGMLLALD